MNVKLSSSSKAVFILTSILLIHLSSDVVKAQMLPIPKGVGLSLRTATYGVEVHAPISVGPRWDVGLQGILFWGDPYYSTLPEFNNAGLKARYFFLHDSPKHYLSMLIGANGFEKVATGDETIGYRPVVGAAYGLEYMLVDQWFGAGFELQGGINFDGESYVGVGISLVFYRN